MKVWEQNSPGGSVASQIESPARPRVNRVSVTTDPLCLRQVRDQDCKLKKERIKGKKSRNKNTDTKPHAAVDNDNFTPSRAWVGDTVTLFHNP